MENQFPYFHILFCVCFFFQMILVSAFCIIPRNACNQLVVIITHPDVVNQFNGAGPEVRITLCLSHGKIETSLQIRET